MIPKAYSAKGLMEKDLKKYEIGFLADSENAKNDIIKILESNQVKIIDGGNISRIRLAYPIKKQTSAFFCHLQFFAAPSIVKSLKDSLRLNSQILRFMIIIAPLTAKVYSVKKPERPEYYKKIEIKKSKPQPILSNEDLEKKLEEILK